MGLSHQTYQTYLRTFPLKVGKSSNIFRKQLVFESKVGSSQEKKVKCIVYIYCKNVSNFTWSGCTQLLSPSLPETLGSWVYGLSMMHIYIDILMLRKLGDEHGRTSRTLGFGRGKYD